MIKKTILTVLVIIFIISFNYGQGWQKSFGGGDDDIAYDMLQLNDSSFIVVGISKSYNSNSEYDILVNKHNKSGDIEWTKIIDFSGNCYGFSISETYDNGYILCGNVDTTNKRIGLVVKIDNIGNTEWSRTFDLSTSYSTFLRDIEKAVDSCYIIVGDVNFDGVKLLKIDDNGNEIWVKTYNEFLEKFRAFAVLESSDSCYYFIGHRDNANPVKFIIKTDISGNEEWWHYYGGGKYEDIVEIENNTFMLVGGVRSIFDDYLQIVKINSSGSILVEDYVQAVYYSTSRDSWGHSISKCNDGNLIICGEHIPNSIYLIKVDINCNIIWEKSYVYSFWYYDLGKKVIPSLDGEYIMLSDYIDICSDKLDYSLLKVDSFGYVDTNFTSTIKQCDTLTCNGNQIKVYTDPYPNRLNSWYVDGVFSGYEAYIEIDTTSNCYLVQIAQNNSPAYSDTTDTLMFNFTSLPIFSLGNDTTICTNNYIFLNAGTSYISYEWSHGPTSYGSAIYFEGDYSVVVTDVNNCLIYSDTITISNYPVSYFGLGNDTIICHRDSIILEVNNAFTNGNWNDGLCYGDSIYADFGNYYVQASDSNNCIAYSDTVYISNYHWDDIDLGNDTTICPNDSLLLFVNDDFIAYNWNNGLSANDSIFAIYGDYYMFVLDSNNCTIISDTISISYFNNSSVSLGSDTSICIGDSLLLFPSGGFISYNWNNGASYNDSLFVNTDGNYFVSLIDSNNCSNFSDTINVIVNMLPGVNILGDSIACGSTLLNEFNGYSNYLWSTGDTTQSVFITNSGTYYLTVTDLTNCVRIDSFDVTINNLPIVNLGPDTVICGDQNLLLDAGIGFLSYIWSTSDTTQMITVDSTNYGIGTIMIYTEVVDSNLCTNSDTIYITFDNCVGAGNYMSDHIIAYPNPTAGIVRVEAENLRSIKVLTLNGKIIFNKAIESNRAEIDLNKFGKGIYILKILTIKEEKLVRIIVQ